MGLGRDFKPNLEQFPIDFVGQGMAIPKDWVESKWTHKMMLIRTKDDNIIEVPFEDLIRAYAGSDAQFAGLDMANLIQRRQSYFGLTADSRPGNQFTGFSLREEDGGGATGIVYVRKAGKVFVSIIDMDRPYLVQGGIQVRQIAGGYGKKKAKGREAQAHHVDTVVEEVGQEFGKFEVKPENIEQVGANYNINKAWMLTGIRNLGTPEQFEEGISVQTIRLEEWTVEILPDGSVRLLPDLVKIEGDRVLEGVNKSGLEELTQEFVENLIRPKSGSPSCAHTEIGYTRVFLKLMLGWNI